MSFNQKDILFEDNHVIVVNKMSGVLVQKDRTGDKSLSDLIKSYIKIKNKKPGNVFLGVVHRIDRPTSGVIVFAKTSKALSRLNKQFVDRKVNKKYLAITNNINCLNSDKLENWIIKNTKQNKSYIHSSPIPGSKIAILRYSLVKELNNYSLLEVIIETGRHHQIRAQLSNVGLTIKGDLKYGSKRSNKDGSIDLHAYKLTFNHPVTKNKIEIKAPFPKRQPWSSFLLD